MKGIEELTLAAGCVLNDLEDGDVVRRIMFRAGAKLSTILALV